MTVPTGMGLTRGMESAGMPGFPLPRRASRAASNNSQRVTGAIPDPCYCGCCNMTRKATNA